MNMTPDDGRDDEFFETGPRGMFGVLADFALATFDAAVFVAFIGGIVWLVVLVVLAVTHR